MFGNSGYNKHAIYGTPSLRRGYQIVLEALLLLYKKQLQ